MSTWVKVYNSLPSHPKTLAANAGLPCTPGWLHVCGFCYSNEHLTDGFIPSYALPVLAPGTTKVEAAARRLVQNDLWHEVDGGWLIHDYTDVQRSADEVRTTRAWDSERKSLFRDRDLVSAIRERDGDCCRYCSKAVNWKNRRGPLGGTYDHVIPRGGNTFENVVVACKSCNSRKGSRTPDQAGMRLLSPPDPDPVPDPDLAPELDTEPDLVLPREDVEKKAEKTEKTPASQVARKRARRTVDQSKRPEGFPEELVEVGRQCLVVLTRIWDVRGGVKPQPRGVGLAILRDPTADHLAVANELEHYMTAGKGQAIRCDDIAKRFGDRVAVAGAAPGGQLVPLSRRQQVVADQNDYLQFYDQKDGAA